MAFLINYFKGILITLIAFFAPLNPLLLTVMFAVLVDMIISIWAQYKVDKTKIKARKMSHTISKLLLYYGCILVLYTIEINLLDGTIPLSKLAATLISLVEFKSIDESYKQLQGYSLWDMIQNKLKRGLEKDE